MTTLIFPMAGQGARFGYTFKPFLGIDDRTFIETAFDPFRAHLDEIEKVLFVFLEEQEQANDVTARLARMFFDVPHEVRILARPTEGPAETLVKGLAGGPDAGAIMVCDCDHALDVAPLFAAARDPSIDCALPTWDIAGEPLKSWGVVGIEAGGRVVAIAEKAAPEIGAEHRGVIGCYYFADVGIALGRLRRSAHVYMSDLVRDYIDAGDRVVSAPIVHARFFGDPERLQQATGDEG